MKLILLNQSRATLKEAWLRRWLKGLAKILSARGYKAIGRKELVLVFVTRPEIRRLNRLYRKKDYATDILSFDPVEPESLGELVLAPAVIRNQSRRTGLSETGELGYMLVHGVLHLLGYDHETSAKDEAEMFALQDAIYAKLAKSVGLK